VKRIADKERLDWLNKPTSKLEPHWPLGWEAGTVGPDTSFICLTARKAIDAAMRAERKAEKEGK
jgi:hypothetical protein